MLAYIFPGQGAQFEGMGKDLYDQNAKAKYLFDNANSVLGFKITDIMFEGDAEALKQTKVTQPAVFLHSIIKYLTTEEKEISNAVAGHSLGELTALVANETLSFEDGLELVSRRALAMQAACEKVEGTMAAILGLEDKQIEDICQGIEEIVIPANYNCPGQLVISGSVEGINKAVTLATEAGARRALVLPVGGAFHSPLMEPAKEDLEKAILTTSFNNPSVPVYQNVTAMAEQDPEKIQANLIAQLTAPVRWTQTMKNMSEDGVSKFVEVGAKVLSGFVRRYDRSIPTEIL